MFFKAKRMQGYSDAEEENKGESAQRMSRVVEDTTPQRNKFNREFYKSM